MSEDTIKRSDAIKAFDGEIILEGKENKDAFEKYMREAFDRLKAIPSADRPQGEWIIRDDNAYCSECGVSEDTFIYGSEYWHGLGLSHYCPNCGTKMRVVKR